MCYIYIIPMSTSSCFCSCLCLHSLENSYRTLYWSLFSMTQLKDIKIQEGQLFTEIVGELLFMAYQTMAVIVLINMLIAMMSNSFQEIEVLIKA